MFASLVALAIAITAPANTTTVPADQMASLENVVCQMQTLDDIRLGAIGASTVLEDMMEHEHYTDATRDGLRTTCGAFERGFLIARDPKVALMIQVMKENEPAEPQEDHGVHGDGLGNRTGLDRR